MYIIEIVKAKVYIWIFTWENLNISFDIRHLFRIGDMEIARMLSYNRTLIAGFWIPSRNYLPGRFGI